MVISLKSKILILFLFSFPVHRAVLAAVNTYFAALLGPSFKEGNEKVIRLQNIDGDTLKLLINYCYTGQLQFTETNLDLVLAGASSFELVRIEEQCCEYLADSVTLDTCLQHFLRADKYSFVHLRKRTFEFIAENFAILWQSEKYLLLDDKCALEIFDSDLLNASEDTVFFAVQKWMEANKPICSDLIANLLKCIRLEYISGIV